jgi:hypothetical protein
MKNTFISLQKAITLSLGDQQTPMVSAYHLAVIVLRLYKHRSYKGHELRLTKAHPDHADVSRALNLLLEAGILKPYPAIASPRMYFVLGRVALSAGEIVCSADPFCYLSHLSAMEYHGLTDRLPPILSITRPAARSWAKFATERAQRDYGDDYEDAMAHGFPKPTRPKFVKRIEDRSVIEFNSMHQGSFRRLKDSPLRVATLGRTYLDMLTRPDLCGGMAHVLSAFDHNATSHLTTIVDELDQHGSAIAKVRAGYILEERCRLQHPSFQQWATLAIRGGSRKLDPKAEYAPRYSEKWSLSINVEEPMDDDDY